MSFRIKSLGGRLVFDGFVTGLVLLFAAAKATLAYSGELDFGWKGWLLVAFFIMNLIAILLDLHEFSKFANGRD